MKRKAGSIVVRGCGGRLLPPRPLGGTIGGEKEKAIHSLFSGPSTHSSGQISRRRLRLRPVAELSNSTKTNNIEALEVFRSQPETFDLVITDMTMPNLTGDKLAGELIRIRPDIPIILCTGFSPLITEEKAKAMGIREFVMKPLVMHEIAKTVRRVLDERD